MTGEDEMGFEHKISQYLKIGYWVSMTNKKHLKVAISPNGNLNGYLSCKFCKKIRQNLVVHEVVSEEEKLKCDPTKLRPPNQFNTSLIFVIFI